MIYKKWQLKRYCYLRDKTKYLKYVDRYTSLNWREKSDIYIEIKMNKLLDNYSFKNVTIKDKIKDFFKKISPNNIFKQKWHDAFLFFYELESKEQEELYQKLGLPKNGLRKDDC